MGGWLNVLTHISNNTFCSSAQYTAFWTTGPKQILLWFIYFILFISDVRFHERGQVLISVWSLKPVICPGLEIWRPLYSIIRKEASFWDVDQILSKDIYIFLFQVMLDFFRSLWVRQVVRAPSFISMDTDAHGEDVREDPLSSLPSSPYNKKKSVFNPHPFLSLAERACAPNSDKEESRCQTPLVEAYLQQTCPIPAAQHLLSGGPIHFIWSSDIRSRPTLIYCVWLV